MVNVRSKHPKKVKHVWGGELEEERVGSYFIWQNLLASCSWTRQLDWACSDLAAGNWTGWTRKKWHSAAGQGNLAGLATTWRQETGQNGPWVSFESKILGISIISDSWKNELVEEKVLKVFFTVFSGTLEHWAAGILAGLAAAWQQAYH